MFFLFQAKKLALLNLILWLCIFQNAEGQKTDPPLITIFKSNSYIEGREVPFKIFLPRNDYPSMDISVDYGDKSTDMLSLISKLTIHLHSLCFIS